MKDTIIIGGSMAQKPGHGGHTWVFLQYLLGFRKLGWDVVFVDQLEPDTCVNVQGQRCSLEESENLKYFLKVMKDFELDGCYALLYGEGDCVIGMSRARLLEKAGQAAVMINVMGYVRNEDVLQRVRRRVFLDIDPGFGQMWQELGLCNMFSGHHAYVTIGENIGQDGCTVPPCGVEWIPSRQPVDLDYWRPPADSTYTGFTTVASWRGTYGPVEFRGKTYGLRVHEFRRIASLPELTNERFDIALDIHPADQADRLLLESNGWTLLQPLSVAGDPHRYRQFIKGSGAELMVAKNMYVETRSGWFSDRSCCYLASGKPVLAQDTGLGSIYPVGEGLVTFKSLDEAVSGVREITGNYARHAQSARMIAGEYFESKKVLRALMDKIA
jgi:hypothetical protein